MEKMFKTKEVLNRAKSKPISWKDVKDFKFEDGDIIRAGYDEPEYSENYSHDGYYYFSVERSVLETDAEFETRIKGMEMEMERMKKNRYQTYLKLKEEFENENI